MRIIYEDEDLLILDKPAGLVTTKENAKGESVEGWIESERPSRLLRQGIAHRLDKGTSGVLVVAKNDLSLRELKRQFKLRVIKKTYLALVGGDLPANGEVNMPIDRSKYVFGKFGVSESGKTAVTKFTRLKRLLIEGKKCSLVEVYPYTGRTHQIRVHFSYLGWPILGDKLYKGQGLSILTRPFLHAAKLVLKHPRTQKELVFESPLPRDLELVLKDYAQG